MRRALGLIIVGMLLIPAIAATAHDTADYRDDFGDGGYGGSDGSIVWSTSWSEDGTDDGSASSGSIHIGSENCSNNECLHMESGLLGSLRVRRAADLSVFDTARLSFDMYIEGSVLSTGVLDIQVRGGGAGWRSVDSYLLNVSGGDHEVSIDVSDFIGSDFELRFRITQLLSGDVYVDRVNIEGELAATPTTSTTTSTSSTSSSTSSTTSTSTTPASSPSSTSSTTSTSTISSVPTGSTNTSFPTTTTTLPGQADRVGDSGTSMTVAPPTTPTSADSSRAEPVTTTTEPGDTTTTSLAPLPGLGPLPPAGGGGLRDPGVGLISDYATGMMGDMSMEQVEVLGAELDADFSMAVEVFEAVKVWGAVLALMVATAVVSGVERRKYRLTRHS